MEQYREEDLIRLARRDHNTRRIYLLVNPLQGKHIPVSPGRALAMMRELGRRTAEKYPDGDFVIGFAETATAVASAVAAFPGKDTRYIQTTREPIAARVPAVCFQEEHSHATDQYLISEHLQEYLERSRRLIFVDDELSTGKTLLNIVRQMRTGYPGMKDMPITAVSLINRMTDERMEAFRQEGIDCLSLLYLPETDYTETVRQYRITGAPEADRTGEWERAESGEGTEDPRFGVSMSGYLSRLRRMVSRWEAQAEPAVTGKKTVIIGTEEYMFPGLMLGEMLEKTGLAESVRFHATTRSPIGLNSDPGYPIRSGFSLPGFYEAGRRTFLYNIGHYDTAILVTDSDNEPQIRKAADALAGILENQGCRRVILFQEEHHVQHL